MRNRNVFIIFLLCTVFSAGFMSASDTDSTRDITVDLRGTVSTIPVGKSSVVSYHTGSNGIDFLVKGALPRTELDNEIVEVGYIGDAPAAKCSVTTSDPVVIERERGKSFEIRSGAIDRLVSLQKEQSLYPSRVSVRTDERGFAFSFSKMPRKMRYFTLADPDRAVFDFIGIKGRIVKKDGGTVRYANHPAGMRVVFEKTDLPDDFTFDFSRSSIALKRIDNSTFAAFTTQRPHDTATAEAKQAAETEKSVIRESAVSDKNTEEKTAKTKKIRVNGVLFVGENPEILKVNLADDTKVERSVNGRKLSIIYRNADIDRKKEQVLDATSLNGPVKEIAIFNSGDDVKIVAEMKDDQYIVRGNKKNEFIFARPEKKQQVREQVAGYSETQVMNVSDSVQGQADQFDTGTSAVDVDISEKQYRGKNISLDFKNADIHDVLRLIADIGHLNIITSDDVGGKVTVRLMNIPWDEALDVILRSKSLGKERMGDVIRVATIQTLQREKESELAKKKAQRKLEPIKARLITVNYAKADELTEQVKGILSERGTLNVDERTNVLIVKDIEEVLDKAEKLIEYLDTQTPQVLIKSRIVEATSQAIEGFGVEWSSQSEFSTGNGHPTGMAFPYNLGFGGSVSVPGPSAPTGDLGFSFGSIGNLSNLDLTLHVMESEGKIRILSSPKVATLDNKEANIKQGMSIPITTRQQGGQITTKYIDATLELTVTPHITAEGSVLLKMKIKKEEPDWSRINYLGEPAIIKKEAVTEVLVKSSDTVVIGGVYTNKKSETVKKIPILGDIPVLGWLFKQKENSVERQELLIFMTPKIMNELKSNVVTMPVTSQN